MALGNLTLNPGSGGGNLPKYTDGTREWVAGVSGFVVSTGSPDVLAVVTPSTGLPVRLADGSGYLSTLPVSLASVPSHAVTNAGTFAVQAAQTGSWTVDLGATDNAVLDAIAASLAGTLVVSGTVTANAGSGTFAVSAAALPLPTGAATAAAQATGNASLATLAGAVSGAEVQVDVVTMPTVTVADGGGSLTVDGTVGVSGSVAVTGTFWQATQPVSVAATVTVTGTGGTFPVTDSGGSLTVDAPVGTPVFVRLSDGASAISTLPVSVSSVPSHDVTNAGTFAVQATVPNGQTAHDGAATGSPLRVGAKAETALSGVTLVADGDATDLYAGVDGVLIVRPHCNLEDIVTGTPVAITDGSSTQVIAAQGAGVKVYVTEVTIANTSASDVTVDLRDGTGGAVKWTFPVPANGGLVKTFGTPLPFSANTAVAADPSAAASTVTVSVLGFKSKV